MLKMPFGRLILATFLPAFSSVASEFSPLYAHLISPDGSIAIFTGIFTRIVDISHAATSPLHSKDGIQRIRHVNMDQ